GLVVLERLGRATGGQERVKLADIWNDLPRRPRLIAVGSWLLLGAVVLVLLEVLERRTGLLSRLQRLSWGRETTGRPRRRFTLWRRRATAVTAVAPAPAIPEPAAVAPPTPPAPAAPAAEEASGMVDALRRARERSRART